MKSTKSETDQLNLRPSITLIKQLERLAEQFRGDVKKKNEIAVDILENYITHWARAEHIKRLIIQKQFDGIEKGFTSTQLLKEIGMLSEKIEMADENYKGDLDDEKNPKVQTKNLKVKQ